MHLNSTNLLVAHVLCGTQNDASVTEATMTLLDGGTGALTLMTYADEDTANAHLVTPK